MALTGKNDRVDTPFDNYKERNREPGGFHVGRSSAAPFFLSQKSVIFLVGVVLTLCMKCENPMSFAAWTLVVFLMTMVWSVTIRLLPPFKNLMLNVFCNTLFVFLFGIGYSFLAEYGMHFIGGVFTGNLAQIYDMYYLTPMAISFSVACDREGDRPNFNWTVLFPTLIGIGVMLLTTLICSGLGITKGFVSIMFASLILFVLSYFLSIISKHGVYFAPAPQYDIFTDVPIRKPNEFRRFILTKLFLFMFSVISVTVTIFALKFASGYGIKLDRYVPLIIAVILGAFMFISLKSPTISGTDPFDFELRNLVRFYEYPAVCTFLSLPFAASYSPLKLCIYIILVILADIMLTGLIISMPRRLILSNRSMNTTGAPAILLTISLIVMVGTVFFVIY